MLPRWCSGKEPACQCRRLRRGGFNPGSGRTPGEVNGNPLQCSCWRISWTEEPGELQSMGSQGVQHD